LTELSLICTIVETYATIVSIVTAFLILFHQNKYERINNLTSQFILKSRSLIEYINREISPAYEGAPFIRVNYANLDDVIDVIEGYIKNRKDEIPIVGLDDVKKLIVLISIAEREKEELIIIKNSVYESSFKPLMDLKSFSIFVMFFVFELAIGLSSLYLIYMNNYLQHILINITSILALIGILPLSYLIYELQFKNQD